MPSLVEAYMLREHGHLVPQKSPQGDGEGAYQPMEDVQEARTSDTSFEGTFFGVEAISTFGVSSPYALSRLC